MKIRAEFNFKLQESGIENCSGYVLGDFTPRSYGGDFAPIKVIVQKMKGSHIDFSALEEKAIESCRVIYE